MNTVKETNGKIKRPRLGEIVVLCPTHGVRCKSNWSGPTHTIYRCPVEGCEFKRAVARPS